MPAAIAPLLDIDSAPKPQQDFQLAAFYSISNCQPGLRGVSLGTGSESERLAETAQLALMLHPCPGPARR